MDAVKPSDCMAFVTGASSGLGLEVVRGLLARGWRVMGCSRRTAALHDPRYEHFLVDLSRPDDAGAWLGAFLADVRSRGPLERVALVNNAGRVEPIAPASGLELDELERSFALNAVVPLWIMGRFIDAFRESDLRVINISSGAATKPYRGWEAYCASKAALRMGGMVAAEEAGERKLAIVSYSPGVLDTPMQRVVREAPAENFPDRQRFVELHEGGSLIHPKLPAERICALLEGEKLPPFSELRYQ